MKKSILALVVLAVLAAIVFWFLTAPVRLDESVTAQMDAGDAARGEMVFWTGGCASCHAADGAKGDEKGGKAAQPAAPAQPAEEGWFSNRALSGAKSMH